MKASRRLLLLTALAAGCASSGSDAARSQVQQEAPQEAPQEAQQARQQFEQVRALVGEWDMEGADADGPEVVYAETAAGSAVVETLFPGAAHEMVTVYFLDGDRLTVTHYCAAGNQPTLVAVPAVGDRIDFEFLRCSNLASPLDVHMHTLALELESVDRVTARWTTWDGGEPAGDTVFTLSRRPAR